jgi:hypothetical protein
MGFETVRLAGLKIWLDGPQAQAYQGALGADEDNALAESKAAVKLRWPLPGCIDDTDEQGLYHAGEHRRILRAPNETGAAYLGRLERAPLAHYWDGTKSGLLLPFEPFFVGIDNGFTPPSQELKHLDPVTDAPMVSIQKAKGRVDPYLWAAHTAPASSFITVKNNGETDGYWDGNCDWFSRVFTFVNSSFAVPWDVDFLWDEPGEWDDGGLWDTTMTSFELSYIRAQIRRNKSPGSYPTTVAIWLPAAPEDGFWESIGPPDALWDDGGVWGDTPTSDPLYLTIGHVWGEENWLGAYGEVPLTDIWPAEDDGLGGWIAFEEDPLQR